MDPELGTPQTPALDDHDAHGFECIRVPIDAGAFDSVIPSGECPDAPTIANTKSKNGCAYEAAGGHRIINDGEKEIAFVSQSGRLGLMNP